MGRKKKYGKETVPMRVPIELKEQIETLIRTGEVAGTIPYKDYTLELIRLSEEYPLGAEWWLDTLIVYTKSQLEEVKKDQKPTQAHYDLYDEII